jgi:peptide-methionine (R)-S-oxide reductase
MSEVAFRPTRRSLLLSGAAAVGVIAVAGGSILRWLGVANAETIAVAPGQVTIIEFSDAGENLGPKTVAKVVKGEDEWKAQLSDLAFRVTRQEDTEYPGTGEYLNNHASGIYRYICCDTAFYDSDTKYESGTGWPSFWQPIAKENVLETEDRSFGVIRTAVSCARCEGHLGHVFNDGPQPTGLRYCMNSVSLKFVQRPSA